MALADRRPPFCFRLPLTKTFPVTACLLPAACLPPRARPITPGGMPPRPTPGRLSTRRATVPRQRMMGRKPLLASLQQTDPRTAVAGGLPSRRRTIMLDPDQGSCCSRRSSPGVEPSTPLRDALLCGLLPATPSIQPNHPGPFSPPFLLAPTYPAPSHRDPPTRAPAPWPRETGPQLSRY
jgi:hypothetical protein